MSLKITNIGKLVTYDSSSAKVEESTKQEILLSDGNIEEIGAEVSNAERVVDAGGGLSLPAL